MKAYGAEIKKFWDDSNFKFPFGDVEHEGGELIDDEGELLVVDSEKYELSESNFGAFDYINVEQSISFAAAFRKWEKAQTHTIMVIKVPLELEDSIRAYLKSQGIKA